jgi:hypothetical protein
LRKVAGEEIVINGDALVTDSRFTVFPLQYAIDEKERIPMRENVHDFLDVLDGL